MERGNKVKVTSIPSALRHRRQEMELQVARLNAALADIDSVLNLEGTLTRKTWPFRIHLHSLWADEREQDVELLIETTLRRAIIFAADKFKRKNNCSDVQAKWTIWVRIGNTDVLIPEELYAFLISSK